MTQNMGAGPPVRRSAAPPPNCGAVNDNSARCSTLVTTQSPFLDFFKNPHGDLQRDYNLTAANEARATARALRTELSMPSSTAVPPAGCVPTGQP